MNEKNTLLRKIISNLKIYGCHLLNGINTSNTQSEEHQSYKIVDEKQRHIYEGNSHGEFIEAFTRYGNSSYDINSFDSCEVLSHPKDDKFKFMIVAEGEGFIADPTTKKVISSSKFVTNQLSSLFYKLGVDELKTFNTINLSDKIDHCMKKINNKLTSSNGKNGTKVVMALIGPEYTYVANLGDLRCYIEDKNMNICQLNEEDSELWNNYRMGYFGDKEEIRYRYDRDKNVSKIGVVGKNRKETFASTYLIKSESYSRIYLFSRGVIDCVSEENLAIINSDLPVERVVETIINLSTNGEKERIPSFESMSSKKYSEVLHGEKDASACVYVKHKNK